jgi:hypothetical protein
VTSETSATITLTGSDLTHVEALFDQNGTTSASGTVYNLSATAGWDSGAGAAIATKAMTASVVVLAPPPPSGFVQGQIPDGPDHQGQIPDGRDHGHFGDFSGMVTDPNAPGGPDFGQDYFFNDFNDIDEVNAEAYVIHTDVDVTVADNGALTFDLPLSKLEAALGGDVVSVTASLADGQPLPDWLQFNNNTGKFAGLVPEDLLTGSIGPDRDSDGYRGHQHDGPQGHGPSITIEVLASKGNLAITDFTVDLKPPKGDRHGWNVLPGDGTTDGTIASWATNRRGRDHVIGLAPGAHRDVATLHAMDRVLWHDAVAFETDPGHGDNRRDLGHDAAPAGRAGLSDQMKTLGWHAAKAEQMALLDSLRQGVAGWR